MGRAVPGGGGRVGKADLERVAQSIARAGLREGDVLEARVRNGRVRVTLHPGGHQPVPLRPRG